MANEIITTLHPDQDPDTNLYPNIKKENIPDYSIDMNKLDPSVKSIISVPSPKVDTTTNILAKTSNDGIYVSSNNGHWYYWDGSQYVDSGMNYLQNAIPNRLLMNLALYTPKLVIDKVNKTITIQYYGYIFTKFNYVSVDSISTKTISYASLIDGTYYLYVRNNALYFNTIFTECEQNDVIIWIGFITNGNINKEIYNSDDKHPHFALYSTGDVKVDIINKNFVINSGYLFYDNSYTSISSKTISYRSFFNRTAILIYREKDFILTDLESYVMDARNNDIILAIIYFLNNGNINKKIFLVNDISNQLTSLDSRVAILENATTETLPKSSKIFMRVGCIGDSYTSGWIKDNNHNSNPNFSWCKYMKQLTGNEYTNFGVSGSSTKSWITGTLGKLAQVQAQGNKCQAYIIGLMINDQNTGMSTHVALGTSSDIGTNNDSYYAYYYKLINAILEVNPNAFIFCNTCPKTDGDFSSYNQAVVDIVTYCKNENKNVYLVDLRNYNWINTTFVNDALNGHYTAIGYEYMAEILNKALCDVINNNALDFQDVNLIEYDPV